MSKYPWTVGGAISTISDEIIAGLDINAKSFGGSIAYVTNGFTFSGEVGQLNSSDLADLKLTTLSLGGSYALANGLSFGVDYARADLERLNTTIIEADVASVFAFHRLPCVRKRMPKVGGAEKLRFHSAQGVC